MIELNLKKLHFNYADRILLKNVNLTIKSQGITGVTGCNGSGKSTFLRLLHGLIKPTSGHINWKSDIAIPKISMVFQKPLMLRRSVLANVQFAAKLVQDKNAPLSYLQQVDLTDLAFKAARSLSGGEQQKLAIARVLALRPDILLLDEPTAHLDGPATLKIENLFHNLSQQGTKIFLVSHDRDQIQRLAYDRLHLQSGELNYN